MSELHSRSAQRRVAAMTPPREPQTAASRRILRQDYRGNESYTVTRDDLLAIEFEAAAAIEDTRSGSVPTTKPDTTAVGGFPLRGISQPADTGTLREALERLLIKSGNPDYATKYGHGWNDALRAALAATPAPAPLDETRLIGALSLAIERHKANRSWAHRCETMCAVQIGGYLYARLTARAAATEDTDAHV